MKPIFNMLFIIVLMFSVVPAGAEYKLPDTGQSKCYNADKVIPCPQPGQDFYGQDAQYTGIQPSYTNLDENGNALPDSATSWAMVKDNNTGLIWENKTNDGSIHDASNQYSWDDAQSFFIAQLNATNFGGYNDWRLPTHQEFHSIVDYSRYNPAINTGYFPNTKSLQYWSSICTSFTYHAWEVNFGSGNDSSAYTYVHHYVRAVRGGGQ